MCTVPAGWTHRMTCPLSRLRVSIFQIVLDCLGVKVSLYIRIGILSIKGRREYKGRTLALHPLGSRHRPPWLPLPLSPSFLIPNLLQ
uniref:Uncharacterized protein n=1 Tax=Arundo donax TaxID=35708 RepID=A0A0A9UD85_ARUDO